MKKRNSALALALLALLLANGPAMSKEKAKNTEMMAPSGQQKKMQEAMMSVRESNKEIFAQIKAKKKELAIITKAEVFDKAAFLAKHGEIEALMQNMAHARAQAQADVLEGMTAQERASMPMMGRKMGGRHGMKGKNIMMNSGMGNMPMQDDDLELSED